MQQWGTQQPPYQQPGYPPHPQWPQQQGYAPQAPLFCCRVCGHQGQATTTDKASTAAWILALVLTLSCVGTLFCWVPLVTMRDKRLSCPRCSSPAS